MIPGKVYFEQEENKDFINTLKNSASASLIYTKNPQTHQPVTHTTVETKPKGIRRYLCFQTHSRRNTT